MTLCNNFKLPLLYKETTHSCGAFFCRFKSSIGGSEGALLGYWVMSMYVLLTAKIGISIVDFTVGYIQPSFRTPDMEPIINSFTK